MLVAVYGSLRKGFGNHRAFLSGQDVTFVGETETCQKFDMYSRGAFPFVVLGQSKLNTTIKVEVYDVGPETLKSLDYLEGYPRFYNRSEIDLQNGMKAWMYHIEESLSEVTRFPPVASGDWKEFKKAA